LIFSDALDFLISNQLDKPNLLHRLIREVFMSAGYTVCPKCMNVNKINLESAKTKVPSCGHCGTDLDYHDGLTNLSTQQVKKLIQKSPLPVVIDFWAPWCAPCRSFAPTFSSVAHSKEGKVVFVKMNTEDHPDAGQQFGIRGIPTVAAFKAGKEVARQSGAMPQPIFENWVNLNL
jgi:thioredoxin 2